MFSLFTQCLVSLKMDVLVVNYKQLLSPIHADLSFSSRGARSELLTTHCRKGFTTLSWPPGLWFLRSVSVCSSCCRGNFSLFQHETVKQIQMLELTLQHLAGRLKPEEHVNANAATVTYGQAL